MNSTLRQEILKELNFLQKQNRIDNFKKSEEKLHEELANALNKIILKEQLSETGLQLAGYKFLKAKSVGDTKAMDAASKMIANHPRGKEILSQLNKVKTIPKDPTKIADTITSGVLKSAPKSVTTASPTAEIKPILSGEGSIISTKAKDVSELAKNLGKTEKEVQALIDAKKITFVPGRSYVVNTAEDVASIAKASTSAEGATTSAASAAAKAAPVTAAEVSAAAKNPSKMLALFERVRVATGSPPVQKFIGTLSKVGKGLAVLGAATYAYQLATDPKSLTVDEHILGGAAVTEVTAMLATSAGFGGVPIAALGTTLSAALTGVAGAAAGGALIGIGLNKLGQWSEEQKVKEEKGEVVMAKGQQAVAMFNEYCKGGYRRGAEADSTLGAIGKGIAATAATILNPLTGGQLAKTMAGKGTHTPNQWNKEDVEDMAILYNTIVRDPSIDPEAKKGYAKCFAPLYGTAAGDVLKQRGIILSEEGITTIDEMAEGLNKVLQEGEANKPVTPTTAPEEKIEDKDEGNYVTCKDDSVIIEQQWLKYVKKYKDLVVDGKYGPQTHKAMAEVNKEVRNLQQVKGSICGWAKGQREGWIKDLKAAGIAEEKIGKIEKSGGGGSKGKKKPTSSEVETSELPPLRDSQRIQSIISAASRLEIDPTDPVGIKNEQELRNELARLRQKIVDIQAKAAERVGPKNVADQLPMFDKVADAVTKDLRESKQFRYESFYDSKKENNAKLLFEKLIKKL